MISFTEDVIITRRPMKKVFVLDTNVLIYDSESLFAFKDNSVFIPLSVLEEIDSFKKSPSENGKNARQVNRYIDNLRKDYGLLTPAPLPNGGELLVGTTNSLLPNTWAVDPLSIDSRILAEAKAFSETCQDKKVVLVTKDINLRVRAAILGLDAEDYDADKIVTDEHYTGLRECVVEGELIDDFYKDNKVDLHQESFEPNQFVVLKSLTGQSAIARSSSDAKQIQPIYKDKAPIWGIRPRNKEQSFALDLLMDDKIKLVSLIGPAGTGKTLMAIAAGLQKITEEKIYQKMLVSRPVFPLGKDIGFLPGDIEEKMSPWMQPIYDNVEFLMGLSQKDKKSGRGYHELMEMGIVEIEPLTYIRGRSIPNQFMIIDEAQNLTPHEVKTILTRAGDNTKIVLAGDPYQIDNTYVDSTNNGLVYAMNRFKGQGIAGTITLSKCERSELAELSSKLL